ncbi:hypothetical protein SLEP1_g14662 [Rubroshorea leprosula]|uniref:Uncharacterized protein n=1 Tax=Rubroshorea leprosula TaxID=152421 RepID=A0AAV5ITU1_9ROSI|nr:hypothetical protein SLEP1_g14662 [Rubroshorea leprosula]
MVQENMEKASGLTLEEMNSEGLLICGDNDTAFASSALMIEAIAPLRGM